MKSREVPDGGTAEAKGDSVKVGASAATSVFAGTETAMRFPDTAFENTPGSVKISMSFASLKAVLITVTT